MADDVPSLRPSLLPPLRSLIVSVGLLVGLAGAVVGALEFRDCRDERRIEAGRQATAEARAIADRVLAACMREPLRSVA